MTPENHTGQERSVWYFRPIILFATAYIINLALHESAHALTAYALNVPFTLYHFAVDLRSQGSVTARMAITLAGPLCSLVLGLVCWLAYRRAKASRIELLLLYLATIGVGTFFGNFIFVGDLGRIGVMLHLPIAARYAATLVGLLAVCGVHFAAGWELRGLAPAGSSRSRALLVLVVLAPIGGIAIVTLASLPMPSTLVLGRLGEVSFWIVAAIGLLISRRVPAGENRTLRIGWADAIGLAAALIVTRLMAAGISFQQ